MIKILSICSFEGRIPKIETRDFEKETEVANQGDEMTGFVVAAVVEFEFEIDNKIGFETSKNSPL